MKRLFALILTAVMAVSVFAGCGGSGKDLNEIMKTINSTYSLSLKTLESKDDLKKYYSVNPDDVKQFAAEIDSNNNAPVEIVLVEAKDATAASAVEKCLANRYNSIIRLCFINIWIFNFRITILKILHQSIYQII